jgi:hypothetical protein
MSALPISRCAGARVIPFPRRAGQRRDRRLHGGGAGPGARPPSDGIDAIIRLTWGMYLSGDITWCGAGQMHDALCDLREAAAR